MGAPTDGERVILGRVSGVFGIKGWVKVWSFTDPVERLLDYPVWSLRMAHGWEEIEHTGGQRQGRGLVVQLAGCHDRDLARRFVNADIGVPRAAMPALAKGEYYWYQLEGLRVLVRSGDAEPVWLGNVDHLFATGANEVVVVKPAEGSIDRRERLLPWVPGNVILQVDLEQGELWVDWDPEY